MTTEEKPSTAIPSLEDWQHWTLVMGRAQQMLMEAWAKGLESDQPPAAWPPAFGQFGKAGADPMALMTAGADAWAKGLDAWGKLLGATAQAGEKKDRRFCRRGMAREPAVRHDPPVLSADLRPAAGQRRRDRGGRRRDAPEIAVHDQELRRRDEPVQFRADQPAGDQAGDRDQGREPAQRPAEHAARPRPGAADPDRCRARSRSAATSR